MFKSLMPWKKKHGDIAVRRDEPTRAADEYPLARLRDEFDMLMERFLEDRWLANRPFANLSSVWGEPRFAGNWDLGWEDKGKEYVFQAELPGFESGDFDIKVRGNLMTVSAAHKEENRQKDRSSYRYGSFTRTFTLPHGVNEEKIDARYHSGVLEVHLPKTEQAQGKRINVKPA